MNPTGDAAHSRPVLYAEDDENDAFLMQHAFRRVSIRNPLVIAADGQAAIEYLENYARTPGELAMPSLVMLDLHLPVRSGFEVLEWVRAQSCLADLLVVILSSSNHSSDIDRAYTLRANAYFVKPSDVGRRMELVRTLHAKWLGEQAASRSISARR